MSPYEDAANSSIFWRIGSKVPRDFSNLCSIFLTETERGYLGCVCIFLGDPFRSLNFIKVRTKLDTPAGGYGLGFGGNNYNFQVKYQILFQRYDGSVPFNPSDTPVYVRKEAEETNSEIGLTDELSEVSPLTNEGQQGTEFLFGCSSCQGHTSLSYKL
jgi:hypothetical protein